MIPELFGLKSFLVYHQVEFPKTHDIDELLDLLAIVDKHLAGSLRDAISLSAYSVEIRYPADIPEMTTEDAKKALQLVSNVREAICSALKEQ